MVPLKTVRGLAGILVVAILVIAAGACGGSSSHNLSQAQVQAISHEMATAAENAVQGALSANAAAEHERPGLAGVVRDLQPDQLPGCTTSGNTTTCNFSINYSGPCPDGGTIAVAGEITGTLNSSGDGSVGTGSAPLTITPANCAVASNLTINGNPDIAFATTITITNDAPVYPVALTETGGLTYGPNPSGSCTVNATYTVSSPTSCTVSGTMCGQTLSGSC